MKFLVVGGGSMGKRRIRCLLANKVEPGRIRLVETRDERRREVLDKHGIEGMPDLDEGLKWGPDAVVVSVPGAQHVPVCLAAARAGKHFFVEVPLSINLDGLDDLQSLVERHKIVAAPGTQPPFHPLFKRMKSWMQDPSFGRPLLLSAEMGQYLPDWHPYEDYRSFYAASAKMGGSNLDVIAQEMATIYWLLEDRTRELFCAGHHLSSLEIDGCDYWQIAASTESKRTAMTLQFDMIRRAGRNCFTVVSEQGTIELDLGAGTVRRFLASNREWETRSTPVGYVYEQCYIDEIGCFLASIRGEAQWHNPLPVAVDVVKFLMAIQRSAREKRTVTI
jgi:predicted dehydrogenase